MRKGRDTDPDIDGDLAAMRRYARALARDHHDADDVVQDAVVRAIERDAGYKRGRSRQRWLLAIVHNVFVSARRRSAAEAPPGWRASQSQWRGSSVTSRATTPRRGRPTPCAAFPVSVSSVSTLAACAGV